MIKKYELSDPNSCLNKARDDEMLFVLLWRDAAAQAAILAWAKQRVRLGKNKIDDPQIVEAIQSALEIAKQHIPSIHKNAGLHHHGAELNPFIDILIAIGNPMHKGIWNDTISQIRAIFKKVTP